MLVRLNKKLYDEETIKEAIKDFEEICSGRIVQEYIEVELEPKAETDKPIDKEFCNYVLGLMKNKTLV